MARSHWFRLALSLHACPPFAYACHRGLRDLYAQADAFVLPTRGEGWGLPIAEAMAMGLPSIATNFSGPSAFLTAENGHPLPVAKHLPDGSAEPSAADLGRAMRRCILEHNTPAGKARAERARSDMQTQFSREAVAQIVLDRLHALERLRKRRLERKKGSSSTNGAGAGAEPEEAEAGAGEGPHQSKEELRALEERERAGSRGRGRRRGRKNEL